MLFENLADQQPKKFAQPKPTTTFPWMMKMKSLKRKCISSIIGILIL